MFHSSSTPSPVREYCSTAVKAKGHLEIFDEERPSQVSKELFGSSSTNNAVETCVQVVQLPQYF
jgi:hypothetical protein